MKSTVSIILMVLLTGCAAKFNQNNYDRMVNVVAISRDQDAVCLNKDSMVSAASIMHRDTVYALEDSVGRQDTDVAKMLTGQLDEIDRFQKLLNGGPVSQFFCKQKVKNIYDTARLIAIEEGNKLKLL